MKRKNQRRIRIAFAAFFLLLTIACFTADNEGLAWLMTVQPGPLLIRLTAGFAASSVAFAFVLPIVTFLFGRFFCAALCPLGVIQDAMGRLRGNRPWGAQPANLKTPRYTIAALTIASLAGGWAVGLRYLDPFSRFGGMLAGVMHLFGGASGASIAPFFVGALLPFACLTALVMWKRRVYCVAVCPIGTILGLFARYGIRQMRVARSCTACGLCEQVCPTGCIDSKAHRVDNERCVRCMNCVAVCPSESISLRRAEKNSAVFAAPTDPGRRAFLLQAGALALGIVGTGHVLGGPIRALARASRANRNAGGLVLPPGAMDAERFAAQCTSCQLCALNCPTKVIRPALYALGPVHLEFDQGACHQDCTRCNFVCPSGALQQLSLEDKQWLKIGEAFCDTSKCRAIKENAACYICQKICPKGAIYMTEAPNGLEVPEVAAFHCIGCGACQSVCPMTPKAIVVTGTEQRLMGLD